MVIHEIGGPHANLEFSPFGEVNNTLASTCYSSLAEADFHPFDYMLKIQLTGPHSMLLTGVT